MAFTLEEVEKALVTPNEEWPVYLMQNTDIQKNANYQTIVDYLTGKSPGLAGLQNDYDLYQFTTLIYLLKDIENVSENDQLVLDVFLDPMAINFTGTILNGWLLQYIFHNRSSGSLNAAVQLFKKQSIPDDDIFQLIIFQSAFADEAYDDLKNSAMHQYLLDYVRQKPTIISFTNHHYSWSNERWSLLYFQLLEDTKPDLAAAYAVSSIYVDSPGIANIFVTYADGKYLPLFEAELKNPKHNNSHETYLKLQFAITLYFSVPSTYQSLIVELSRSFLEGYANGGSKTTWERYIALASSDFGAEPYNLKTSSAAFYFLLKYEKEQALQMLELFFETKTPIQVETMGVLYHYLGKQTFPYIEKNLKAASGYNIYYFREAVNFIQENFEAAVYTPLLWSFANNKSKAVRELVAKVIAEKDADAENNAIQKLEHKNAETRQTAALILGYFSGAKTMTAVMKVLNSEKNDNARDILLQSIEANLPKETSMEFINEMITAAKERGKLDKPVSPWMAEENLPPLFYTSGEQLPVDDTRFLLYRMSRIKEMRSDVEARYLLKMINREKSNDFALAIMQLFKDKNAKPEDKWIMALAALLGDDAIADKTRLIINKWIEENRYKMAEHGVGALSLQGSDTALRWVEWYSRKYKSKKANVGAAALKALETAAEELGISIQELGDKVVPDFGFDGLFKTFQVAGEEHRAFIDSNFKMAFFNEDNKKLKSIPAATDKLLKDEFKSIAKEVRDVVKSQSPRLEYYLIIQRRWSYSNWQAFFLQNPVMFIYATKMLWAVYDNENNLLQTFICNEDTSLLNIESEEITIADDAMIGIVHPSQLQKVEAQQWEKLFFEMKIDPVFPQLARHMPAMIDIDLEQKMIVIFAGTKMKEGSIRSTLEKHGWSQGPVGDGGMIDSFKLLYLEKKMEAVLEVEGVGAGYGWGGEEKLNRLYIVDKSKVMQKWFYPKDKDDENLVKLQDAPGIFLNEILAAIELIKPADK